MHQSLSELVSFRKRYDKKILVCFSVRFDIIQVKWKTFTLLRDKFTPDKMCQTLSESVGFCRRYDRKNFGVFLSVHSVFFWEYVVYAG